MARNNKRQTFNGFRFRAPAAYVRTSSPQSPLDVDSLLVVLNSQEFTQKSGGTVLNPPTAVGTNYYTRILSGFLQFERV